jgi:hypothetical protein
MKKRSIAILAVVAVSVGVLVVNLLPATGQVVGNKFTLCEKDTHDHEFDVDYPPEHFSVVDVFMFHEPEYNTSGDRVGTVWGRGRVVKIRGKNDAVVSLNVSLNLHRGDLELQGTAPFSKFGGGHPLAIIGGTGQYNNVAGVVKLYSRACEGVGGGDQGGDHTEVILK